MKRRHFVRLFILFFMSAFLLTAKFLSWDAIQKVQSNPKEYFFVNSEPIQTVHVGIYNDKLLVGYVLFSSREQVEIDYAIGDLKREDIPLAINKKNGDIVRMSIAFSSRDICLLLCYLMLYIGEIIYFKVEKNKMILRKSIEKTKEMNEKISHSNVKVKRIKLAKKNECTKEVKTVIIKIKREEDVDYDWIKIWCEEISPDNRRKVYKSRRVKEIVKWKMGDVITVLVNPRKESDYEVVTEYMI